MSSMFKARFSHGAARLIGLVAGLVFLWIESLVLGELQRLRWFSVLAPGREAWVFPYFLVPYLVYRSVWAWCSSLIQCPSGCGRMISVHAGSCMNCGAPVERRR